MPSETAVDPLSGEPMPPLAPLATFAGDRWRWWHGEPEGWSLEGDGMSVEAAPGRDWWRRTFYAPELKKGDGPAYLTRVHHVDEFTFEIAFTLTAKSQFDQAGVFIYVAEEVWLKAGIEVVDGTPRLSTVVTNQWSDWSTQTWAEASARLRVTKVKGEAGAQSVVIEAAPLAGGDFTQIRVAPLRHGLDSHDKCAPHWFVGVTCLAPVAAGGSAVFHSVSLGARAALPHEPDAAADVPRPPEEPTPADAAEFLRNAPPEPSSLPSAYDAPFDPENPWMVTIKPKGSDPLDPESKWPANWPFHIKPEVEFIRS